MGDIRTFPCDVCGTLYLVERARDGCEDVYRQRYRCDYCGEVYTSKDDYKRCVDACGLAYDLAEARSYGEISTYYEYVEDFGVKNARKMLWGSKE